MNRQITKYHDNAPEFDLKTITANRTNRPLSIASRVWIAADNVYPPFWTNFVFEGTGTLDVNDLREAVRIVSQANPGSRLVLKGHLNRSYWTVGGPEPLVREIKETSWDGYSSEHFWELTRTSDVRKGPNVEVVLVRTNPLRIMFRAHHAVMDGRGTGTWAEDIFRVLRGEPPLGSDHLLVENDLLYLPDKTVHKPLKHEFISPMGPPEGSEPGFVWKRATVKGRYSNLLARVLLVSAMAAWRYEEGPVRLGIPVDLRARLPQGTRSTGNLTNAIYINVTREATVQEIASSIKKRLELKDDGKLDLEDKLIPYIPISMLTKLLVREDQQALKNNRYRCSGFVSNVGYVDLSKFSGGGFKATAFFALPINTRSFPFSLGITGYNDSVEFILRVPRIFATGGRLNETLEFVAGRLSEVQ